MNSGFDPVVLAPGLWKTQTATQQTPFHFGGSQVPINLGMRGSGINKINRPKIPEALMRERMMGEGASSSVMPMDSAIKKQIQYEIRRLGGKKTRKGKMVDDALKEAGSDIVKLRKLLDMAEEIDQIVMK
jgi:hypothetical protein